MIIIAAAFLLVTDSLVVLQYHTGGSAAMLNIIRGVTRNSTTSSVILLLHNSSDNFTGGKDQKKDDDMFVYLIKYLPPLNQPLNPVLQNWNKLLLNTSNTEYKEHITNKCNLNLKKSPTDLAAFTCFSHTLTRCK